MSKLNDYVAVVSADIHLENECTTIQENLVLTNVDSYTSAVELVEEYYGNSLMSFEITLIEGPFLHVNDDTLENIMTEEV